MPVADYKTYCKMIDHALEKKFAYPAINVTSLTTANGVLKGLADSKSDGIIQISTGGAAFASGLYLKDMPLGAISISEHVHRVAERYPIFVALHTDYCEAKMLDRYMIPLIEETERRRAAGKPNLFNSHMFDGSDLPLKENLRKNEDACEGVLDIQRDGASVKVPAVRTKEVREITEQTVPALVRTRERERKGSMNRGT